MARLIRPFDFILDAGGWQPLDAVDTVLEQGILQLQTQESLLPPLDEPNGSLGGYTLPRGIVLWGDQIFIADPAYHRILSWRPCAGAVTPLPTIGGQGGNPRQLQRPLGLTLSHRHDLVVADSDNRRLLFFTLPGLALRRVLGPLDRAGQAWHPIDVTTGADGNLYVADDANRLIWKLDRQGRPDPRYGGQLPEAVVPIRVQVDRQHRLYVVTAAAPPATARDATRLQAAALAATAPDRAIRNLLILNRYGRLAPALDQLAQAVSDWIQDHIPATSADARNARFDLEGQARAALLPQELSQAIDVRINQFMVAAQRRQPQVDRDQLWLEQRDAVYAEVIPQAYAELLPLFLHRVLPASRLTLAGDRLVLLPPSPQSACRDPQLTDLVVDDRGHLVLSPESGTPAAAPETARPYLIYRPPVATFKDSGLFRIQPLDSRQVGNVWHRLVLDLHAPERTSVQVFSLTSDVPRPDVSAVGLLSDPPQLGNWRAAPANADEWLIQSPPGRYLYLALVLKGPGDRTPSVERIYLYRQRQSSLRYLPALYQSDETSRDLLDRLLSLYDTIFGEIESAIEDFPLGLDVLGAPSDFLPWLASWFDLSLEQTWTDAQKRRFIQRIVELYSWRGTIRGLRLLLQLHANLQEPMPQIIEHYRSTGNTSEEIRQWFRQSPTEDPTRHFTVLLPADRLDTPEKRAAIDRLLTLHKPAQTHYTLLPVFPGIRLGSATRPGVALGLDSLLGSHPVWQLPPDTAQPGILGGRTHLPAAPLPPAVMGRLGSTRLGVARLGCRTNSPCPEQ